MTFRPLAALTTAFALAGFLFSGTATSDFAKHLDRQVHAIHCSVAPGIVAATTEESGCRVTLMSRYSSVLRTELWGGIPMSLLGMGTFAFLAAFGLYLTLSPAGDHRSARRFQALAWVVPVITSCIMGYFALVELDAACKVCISIYTSSALGFAAAVVFALKAPAAALGAADDTLVSAPPSMTGAPGAPFGPPPSPPDPGFPWLAVPLAGVFVAVPVAGYVAAMPDYSAFTVGCGSLPAPEDRYGVFVPLSGTVAGKSAIEVLDPLCPSCRGLEGRLEASGLDAELHRKALLFPLDDECNWMVGTALHPGACAVSEAMLCEPDQAATILDWAFEHQQAIIAAERARDGAAASMVTAQFPAVRGCVGSSRIRSQLHRGLRWAVTNQLPVMTPQLFVEGVKLCNEDTDLGLEYTLSRMLERSGGGAP